MAETMMPLHEFDVVIGGNKVKFFVLLKRWSWVKHEGVQVGGCVGLLLGMFFSR